MTADANPLIQNDLRPIRGWSIADLPGRPAAVAACRRSGCSRDREMLAMLAALLRIGPDCARRRGRPDGLAGPAGAGFPPGRLLADRARRAGRPGRVGRGQPARHRARGREAGDGRAPATPALFAASLARDGGAGAAGRGAGVPRPALWLAGRPLGNHGRLVRELARSSPPPISSRPISSSSCRSACGSAGCDGAPIRSGRRWWRTSSTTASPSWRRRYSAISSEVCAQAASLRSTKSSRSWPQKISPSITNEGAPNTPRSIANLV